MAWMVVPMAFALGLAAFMAWRHVQKEQRSQSWPCTPGEILRSGIKKESLGSAMLIGGTAVWVPNVEYAYSVHRRTCTGNQVAFGGFLYTSVPDRAEAKASEYPVGKHVSVFYDPKNPALSCLERTPGGAWPGYVAVALLAGSAVALLGLAVL